MDLFTLKGKLAVATGAASGIGREIAIQFSRAGADLAIVDVNEEGLRETASLAETAGARVQRITADLTDIPHIRDIVQSITDESGAIDIFNQQCRDHRQKNSFLKPVWRIGKRYSGSIYSPTAK